MKRGLGVVFFVGLAVGYYWGKSSAPLSTVSPSTLAAVNPDAPSSEAKVALEKKVPVSNIPPGSSIAIPESETKIATAQTSKAASAAEVDDSSDEVPSAASPTATPRANKLRLDALSDTREIRAFLKEDRKKNLFDVIKTAEPYHAMTETLSHLQGRFIGEVRLFGKPRKTWEMAMDIRLNLEEGKLKGSTLITLSENGKVFSSQNGSGNMDSNFSATGGLAILVRASPEAYFEFYYAPRLDSFIGNYYEQSRPDLVVPKGTARLERN